MDKDIKKNETTGFWDTKKWRNFLSDMQRNAGSLGINSEVSELMKKTLSDNAFKADFKGVQKLFGQIQDLQGGLDALKTIKNSSTNLYKDFVHNLYGTTSGSDYLKEYTSQQIKRLNQVKSIVSGQEKELTWATKMIENGTIIAEGYNLAGNKVRRREYTQGKSKPVFSKGVDYDRSGKISASYSPYRYNDVNSRGDVVSRGGMLKTHYDKNGTVVNQDIVDYRTSKSITQPVSKTYRPNQVLKSTYKGVGPTNNDIFVMGNQRYSKFVSNSPIQLDNQKDKFGRYNGALERLRQGIDESIANIVNQGTQAIDKMSVSTVKGSNSRKISTSSFKGIDPKKMNYFDFETIGQLGLGNFMPTQFSVRHQDGKVDSKVLKMSQKGQEYISGILKDLKSGNWGNLNNDKLRDLTHMADFSVINGKIATKHENFSGIRPDQITGNLLANIESGFEILKNAEKYTNGTADAKSAIENMLKSTKGTMVGHNIRSFDNEVFKQLGVDFSDFKFLDTLEMAKKYYNYGDMRQHNSGGKSVNKRLMGFSQSHLQDFFNIDMSDLLKQGINQHTAEYDTELNKRIAEAMFKEINSNQVKNHYVGGKVGSVKVGQVGTATKGHFRQHAYDFKTDAMGKVLRKSENEWNDLLMRSGGQYAYEGKTSITDTKGVARNFAKFFDLNSGESVYKYVADDVDLGKFMSDIFNGHFSTIKDTTTSAKASIFRGDTGYANLSALMSALQGNSVSQRQQYRANMLKEADDGKFITMAQQIYKGLEGSGLSDIQKSLALELMGSKMGMSQQKMFSMNNIRDLISLSSGGTVNGTASALKTFLGKNKQFFANSLEYSSLFEDIDIASGGMSDSAIGTSGDNFYGIYQRIAEQLRGSDFAKQYESQLKFNKDVYKNGYDINSIVKKSIEDVNKFVSNTGEDAFERIYSSSSSEIKSALDGKSLNKRLGNLQKLGVLKDTSMVVTKSISEQLSKSIKGLQESGIGTRISLSGDGTGLNLSLFDSADSKSISFNSEGKMILDPNRSASVYIPLDKGNGILDDNGMLKTNMMTTTYDGESGFKLTTLQDKMIESITRVLDSGSIRKNMSEGKFSAINSALFHAKQNALNLSPSAGTYKQGSIWNDYEDSFKVGASPEQMAIRTSMVNLTDGIVNLLDQNYDITPNNTESYNYSQAIQHVMDYAALLSKGIPNINDMISGENSPYSWMIKNGKEGAFEKTTSHLQKLVSNLPMNLSAIKEAAYLNQTYGLLGTGGFAPGFEWHPEDQRNIAQSHNRLKLKKATGYAKEAMKKDVFTSDVAKIFGFTPQDTVEAGLVTEQHVYEGYKKMYEAQMRDEGKIKPETDAWNKELKRRMSSSPMLSVENDSGIIAKDFADSAFYSMEKSMTVNEEDFYKILNGKTIQNIEKSGLHVLDKGYNLSQMSIGNKTIHDGDILKSVTNNGDGTYFLKMEEILNMGKNAHSKAISGSGNRFTVGLANSDLMKYIAEAAGLSSVPTMFLKKKLELSEDENGNKVYKNELKQKDIAGAWNERLQKIFSDYLSQGGDNNIQSLYNSLPKQMQKYFSISDGQLKGSSYFDGTSWKIKGSNEELFENESDMKHFFDLNQTGLIAQTAKNLGVTYDPNMIRTAVNMANEYSYFSGFGYNPDEAEFDSKHKVTMKEQDAVRRKIGALKTKDNTFETFSKHMADYITKSELQLQPLRQKATRIDKIVSTAANANASEAKKAIALGERTLKVVDRPINSELADDEISLHSLGNHRGITKDGKISENAWKNTSAGIFAERAKKLGWGEDYQIVYEGQPVQITTGEGHVMQGSSMVFGNHGSEIKKGKVAPSSLDSSADRVWNALKAIKTGTYQGDIPADEYVANLYSSYLKDTYDMTHSKESPLFQELNSKRLTNATAGKAAGTNYVQMRADFGNAYSNAVMVNPEHLKEILSIDKKNVSKEDYNAYKQNLQWMYEDLVPQNNRIKNMNSVSSLIDGIVNAVTIENSTSGPLTKGLESMFHRFPSTNGLDEYFGQLFVSKGLQKGNISVGAGLALRENLDFDGDVQYAALLGLNNKFKDKNEWNKFRKENTKIRTWDENISKKLQAKVLSEANVENSDVYDSENVVKALQQYNETVSTPVFSKKNFGKIGGLSNFSTAVRNKMKNAGIDETSSSATIEQKANAIMTRSVFELFEQDAISSKKVAQRMLSKSEGNEKALIDDLDNFYKMLSSMDYSSKGAKWSSVFAEAERLGIFGKDGVFDTRQAHNAVSTIEELGRYHGYGGLKGGVAGRALLEKVFGKGTVGSFYDEKGNLLSGDALKTAGVVSRDAYLKAVTSIDESLGKDSLSSAIYDEKNVIGRASQKSYEKTVREYMKTFSKNYGMGKMTNKDIYASGINGTTLIDNLSQESGQTVIPELQQQGGQAGLALSQDAVAIIEAITNALTGQTAAWKENGVAVGNAIKNTNAMTVAQRKNAELMKNPVNARKAGLNVLPGENIMENYDNIVHSALSGSGQSMFTDELMFRNIRKAELDQETHKYFVDGKQQNIDFSLSQAGILGREHKTFTESFATSERKQLFKQYLNGEDIKIRNSLSDMPTVYSSANGNQIRDLRDLEDKAGYYFQDIAATERGRILGDVTHDMLDQYAKLSNSQLKNMTPDAFISKYFSGDIKNTKIDSLSKEWSLAGGTGSLLDNLQGISGNTFKAINDLSIVGIDKLFKDASKNNLLSQSEQSFVGEIYDPVTGALKTFGGTFDAILKNMVVDYKTAKNPDVNKFAVQLEMLLRTIESYAGSGLNDSAVQELYSQISKAGIAIHNTQTGNTSAIQLTRPSNAALAKTMNYIQYSQSLQDMSEIRDPNFVDLVWTKGDLRRFSNNKLQNAYRDISEFLYQGSTSGGTSEENFQKFLSGFAKDGLTFKKNKGTSESNKGTSSWFVDDNGQRMVMSVDFANGRVSSPSSLKVRELISDDEGKYLSDEQTYSHYLNEYLKAYQRYNDFSLSDEEQRHATTDFNKMREKLFNFEQQGFLTPEKINELRQAHLDSPEAEKMLKAIGEPPKEASQRNYANAYQRLSEAQNKIRYQESLPTVLRDSKAYDTEIMNAQKAQVDLDKARLELYSKEGGGVRSDVEVQQLQQRLQDYVNFHPSKLGKIPPQEASYEDITRMANDDGKNAGYNKILSERLTIIKRLIAAQNELNSLVNSGDNKAITNATAKRNQAQAEFDNINKNIAELNPYLIDANKQIVSDTMQEQDKILSGESANLEKGTKEYEQRKHMVEDLKKYNKEILDLQEKQHAIQTKMKKGKATTDDYAQLQHIQKQISDTQAIMPTLDKDGFISDKTGAKFKTTEAQQADIRHTFAQQERDYNKRIAEQTMLASGSKGLGNYLKNLSKQTIGYFGMSMSYKIIGIITQTFSSIIQKTKEFNKTMIDIQIVTGNTTDEVGDMIKEYNQYAKELGVTTQAVATAANQFLRMGYNAQETAQLIDSSMKLSKLGMIEAGKAAEYLTSAIKGYQLSADESKKVVDMATTLDMSYAVDAGYIFEAMARTATSAKLARVEMSELQSMIAVVGETTQKDASVVGESMKTAFARYGNVKAGVASKTDVSSLDEQSREELEAVNDIERVLSTYNIDVRESDNKTWRSYSDILKDINEQWAKYSDYEKNAITTALFGTRQRENGLVVLEKYNEILNATQKAESSEGRADKKYETYLTGLEAAQARFTASWEKFINDINGSKGLELWYNALTQGVKLLEHWRLILIAIGALKAPQIFTALGKMSNSWGGAFISANGKFGKIKDGFKQKGWTGVGQGIKGAWDDSMEKIKKDAEQKLNLKAEVKTANNLLSQILQTLQGKDIDGNNDSNTTQSTGSKASTQSRATQNNSSNQNVPIALLANGQSNQRPNGGVNVIPSDGSVIPMGGTVKNVLSYGNNPILLGNGFVSQPVGNSIMSLPQGNIITDPSLMLPPAISGGPAGKTILLPETAGGVNVIPSDGSVIQMGGTVGSVIDKKKKPTNKKEKAEARAKREQEKQKIKDAQKRNKKAENARKEYNKTIDKGGPFTEKDRGFFKNKREAIKNMPQTSLSSTLRGTTIDRDIARVEDNIDSMFIGSHHKRQQRYNELFHAKRYSKRSFKPTKIKNVQRNSLIPTTGIAVSENTNIPNKQGWFSQKWHGFKDGLREEIAFRESRGEYRVGKLRQKINNRFGHNKGFTDIPWTTDPSLMLPPGKNSSEIPNKQGWFKSGWNKTKSGISKPFKAWNNKVKTSPVAANATAMAGSMLGMVGGGMLGNALGGEEHGAGLGLALGMGNQILTALNPVAGAIVGGAMTAIGGLMSWIKKKEQERIQEAQKAYQESLDKVTNLENNEDKFARYDELAKGVNNLGNNVSLSETDYKEFQSLGNELGEAFPEFVMGLDSAGNSLLGFNGEIGNTSEKLGELANTLEKQAARDYLKTDNLKGVYSDLGTTKSTIDKENREIKKKQDDLIWDKVRTQDDSIYLTKEEIRELSSKGFDTSILSDNYNSYYDAFYIAGSVVKDTLANEKTSDAEKKVLEEAKKITKEKNDRITTEYNKNEAEIKKNNQEWIQEINKKEKEIINNVITENDSYNNMSDNTRSIIVDVLEGKIDMYADDVKDDPDALKSKINDLLTNISPENLQVIEAAYNDWLEVDLGTTSLNNASDALDTTVTEIAEKMDVSKDDVKKRLNFDNGITDLNKKIEERKGKNTIGINWDDLSSNLSVSELKTIVSLDDATIKNIIDNGSKQNLSNDMALKKYAVESSQKTLQDVSSSLMSALRNYKDDSGKKIYKNYTDDQLAELISEYKTNDLANENELKFYFERAEKLANKFNLSIDEFILASRKLSHIDINGFANQSATTIAEKYSSAIEAKKAIESGNVLTPQQLDNLASMGIISAAQENEDGTLSENVLKELNEFVSGDARNITSEGLGGYYLRSDPAYFKRVFNSDGKIGATSMGSYEQVLSGLLNTEEIDYSADYSSYYALTNDEITDKITQGFNFMKSQDPEKFKTLDDYYDYLITFASDDLKNKDSWANQSKKDKAWDVTESIFKFLPKYLDEDKMEQFSKDASEYDDLVDIFNQIGQAETNAQNYYSLQDLRQKISRQKEDSAEQLKDLEVQKRLNELEHYLQKRNLLIDRYNNQISNADWALDIIAPSDYFSKLDITSNKLEATLNKYNELQSQFKELSEMTPQSPEEAQKIADTMKSITDQMPELTKELAKAEETLKNIALDAISESIDNVTSAFDRQRKVLNNSVEMSMSFTGVSSSLDLLGLDYTPLIENKTEVEKKQNEYETLLSMQEDFQNESLESQNTYLDLLKTDQEEEYFKNKKRLREDDISSLRSYYNELWAFAKLGTELTEAEKNSIVSYFKNAGVDYINESDFYKQGNGKWKYSYSGKLEEKEEEDNPTGDNPTGDNPTGDNPTGDNPTEDSTSDYIYEYYDDIPQDGKYYKYKLLGGEIVDLKKEDKAGGKGHYKTKDGLTRTFVSAEVDFWRTAENYRKNKKNDPKDENKTDPKQTNNGITQEIEKTITSGIENVDVNSEEIKSSMEIKIKDFLGAFKTTWDEYLKDNTDKNLVLSFASLLGYSEEDKNTLINQFSELGTEIAKGYMVGITSSLGTVFSGLELGKGPINPSAEMKDNMTNWINNPFNTDENLLFGENKNESNLITHAFASLVNPEALALEMKNKLSEALTLLLNAWNTEIIELNKLSKLELSPTWWEDGKDSNYLSYCMYAAVKTALEKAVTTYNAEKIKTEFPQLPKPELNKNDKSVDGWGAKGLVQDMIDQVKWAMGELNKDSSNWKLNAPTPDKTSWETFGQTIGEYISDGIDKGVEIGLARQAEDSINIPEGEGSAGSMSSTATSSGSIPTGAAMYFHSPYDKINGHVGIYGGDGYIYHLGKGVKKNTLSELESKGYVYRGWGWSGGKDQSAQGNKIAEEAKKMSSYGYQSGSCQRWVSKVYQEALGGDRYQYTRPSAKIAGDEWIIGHSREGSSGISINQNTAIGRLISKKANEHNLLQGLYLDDVGYISAKYEGGKVGAIATVKGDHGGTSYGIPMFATNTGSADAFISWLKETYPNIGSYFSSHKAGTSYFNEAWKKAANDFPDIFAQAQIQYGIANIVEPQYKKILNKYGLDMKRNPALYEALISMAYQYNNLSSGLLNGYKPDMTDREIIELIYNNKANNIGNNFQSSSKAVQRGIANRIKNEYRDVLSLLSYEKGTSYHKGGKALLGDENLLKGSNKPSPEALIYPNGKVEIVGEDGPVIKDIPVGTQVLTTSQTKSLFNNIPSYADGSYSGGAYFTKDNIDNITEDAKKMLEEILTPFEKSAKNILMSYQNKSFYKRSTLENFNQIDEDTVDYIDRVRNQSISSAYMKENQLQTLHMEGRLYNDQIDVLVKKYKELQESGADEATLNTVLEQIDKLQDAVKNVNNQLSEWLNSMISYAVAVKEAFSAQIEHENTMLDLTHSLGGFGEKTDANYYSQKRERFIASENETVAAMEEVKQRIISKALESGDSYEQALEKVYANEDYRRLEQERLQEKQKRKELLQEELDNNKQLIDYKQTILDLERSERWTSVQSINDYYAQTDNYLEQRIKFLKEALMWENLSHEEYIAYSKELAQAEKDRANNIKEQLEALQDFYNRQYDSMNYMVQEYITALNDEKETISKTYDEEIRKLQTVNDQKERSIKLTELQNALDNAKKEKKRVYRAGVGFVYEENREEINKAEKELEDFYSQDRIDSMNEAKELELKALDERIEGWNKYLEAIEKVYKTAERHDHMRNLEKLYGVEGWNGIWDVLDSDLNTFLTNKESGQDIYYGENTELLHNYIETSGEIYKKMDEIVDVLKDISEFVQSDLSYSTIKWTDLMYDVDDFDAASSDQTMIDMLNKKYPGLNIDSKLLSRFSIEKSNELTGWINNLLKENPYRGMNYLRTIVEGGKNDTQYTDKAVLDAYNIALDKIVTDPQLKNKLINQLIKKTEAYEGFDIGNDILSKFERGEITDFDGYDYNMWNEVRETKIQQKVDSGVWTKEQGNEYLNRKVAQGVTKDSLNIMENVAEYNKYNSTHSLANIDSETIKNMSVVSDGSGIIPVNNPEKENVVTLGNNSVYNDNSTKYYFAQKQAVDVAGAINNATTKSDPMGVVNA